MKLLFVALLFIGTTAHAFPMRLEWDATTTMTDGSPAKNIKYRLYRRNAVPSTAKWFKVVETFNTYYTAQVLQYGKFIYRVTAFNDKGESVPSIELPIAIELCAREDK